MTVVEAMAELIPIVPIISGPTKFVPTKLSLYIRKLLRSGPVFCRPYLLNSSKVICP
jgi:hypothetical protein